MSLGASATSADRSDDVKRDRERKMMSQEEANFAGETVKLSFNRILFSQRKRGQRISPVGADRQASPPSRGSTRSSRMGRIEKKCPVPSRWKEIPTFFLLARPLSFAEKKIQEVGKI